MQPSNQTDKPSTPGALPQASTKSAVSLSDAEVICSFMEPHPKALHGGARSVGGWWVRAVLHVGMGAAYKQIRQAQDGSRCTDIIGPWKPRILTLNECREVQERLTDEQWAEYRGWFMVEHQLEGHRVPFGTYLLHATAEQKTKALAAVLRSAE